MDFSFVFTFLEVPVVSSACCIDLFMFVEYGLQLTLKRLVQGAHTEDNTGSYWKGAQDIYGWCGSGTVSGLARGKTEWRSVCNKANVQNEDG